MPTWNVRHISKLRKTAMSTRYDLELKQTFQHSTFYLFLGEIGTYPNCRKPECPSGTSGIYPNCIKPQCPPGMFFDGCDFVFNVYKGFISRLNII